MLSIGAVANPFLAAPLVAGYVAILLSLKDTSLPFREAGISNQEFVTRIRNFLRDHRSRTGPKGDKILHNGITKREYESAYTEELQGLFDEFITLPPTAEGIED